MSDNLLKHILEPLIGISFENLRLVVTRLKQSDGEGWAVGEMLERIIKTAKEMEND
jgi:hypothetical protein